MVRKAPGGGCLRELHDRVPRFRPRLSAKPPRPRNGRPGGRAPLRWHPAPLLEGRAERVQGWAPPGLEASTRSRGQEQERAGFGFKPAMRPAAAQAAGTSTTSGCAAAPGGRNPPPLFPRPATANVGDIARTRRRAACSSRPGGRSSAPGQEQWPRERSTARTSGSSSWQAAQAHLLGLVSAPSSRRRGSRGRGDRGGDDDFA